MFSHFGWEFEFEPRYNNINGWIPDFVIFGKTKNILVEIKPFSKLIEFKDTIQKIRKAITQADTDVGEGRDDDLQGLRQDHLTPFAPSRQAERLGRLPLIPRDCLDARPCHVGEIGTRLERHDDEAGLENRGRVAGQIGQRVMDPEKL